MLPFPSFYQGYRRLKELERTLLRSNEDVSIRAVSPHKLTDGVQIANVAIGGAKDGVSGPDTIHFHKVEYVTSNDDEGSRYTTLNDDEEIPRYNDHEGTRLMTSNYHKGPILNRHRLSDIDEKSFLHNDNSQSDNSTTNLSQSHQQYDGKSFHGHSHNLQETDNDERKQLSCSNDSGLSSKDGSVSGSEMMMTDDDDDDDDDADDANNDNRGDFDDDGGDDGEGKQDGDDRINHGKHENADHEDTHVNRDAKQCHDGTAVDDHQHVNLAHCDDETNDEAVEPGTQPPTAQPGTQSSQVQSIARSLIHPAPPSQRKDEAEIKFSLSYFPTSGRLTFTAIKGKRLFILPLIKFIKFYPYMVPNFQLHHLNLL